MRRDRKRRDVAIVWERTAPPSCFLASSLPTWRNSSKKRLEIYHRIDRLWIDDAVAVPLYQQLFQ